MVAPLGPASVENAVPVRRLQYRRLTSLKFDKPTDISDAEWQLAPTKEPFSEAHGLQISGQRMRD